MIENPFKTQIGGSHYKDYSIQPYEFFFRNEIPHHKAAIIRRILRYDHETGKGIEDLRKIKHEIDLIISLDGSESPEDAVEFIASTLKDGTKILINITCLTCGEKAYRLHFPADAAGHPLCPRCKTHLRFRYD